VAEPLTPEEIDALLNSLKESSTSAAPEPAPVAEIEVTAPANPVPFGDLSRDTATKLSSVADSIRFSLEKSLKHILQLPFTLRVTHVGMAGPSSSPACLLRLSDSAIGALEFDNNLAAAMADRLMGGQARPLPRPVAELELAILKPVFESMAEAVSHALRHYGLSAVAFRDEETRFDSGVRAGLEFDLNGLKGEVRFLFPNLFTPNHASADPMASDDWVIELGRAEMTAHALLDLKVGQIIKLDRHAEASLVLKTADSEFPGRPVLDGDRLLFSVSPWSAELPLRTPVHGASAPSREEIN